jgi:hypothetical protein
VLSHISRRSLRIAELGVVRLLATLLMKTVNSGSIGYRLVGLALCCYGIFVLGGAFIDYYAFSSVVQVRGAPTVITGHFFGFSYFCSSLESLLFSQIFIGLCFFGLGLFLNWVADGIPGYIQKLFHDLFPQ